MENLAEFFNLVLAEMETLMLSPEFNESDKMGKAAPTVKAMHQEKGEKAARATEGRGTCAGVGAPRTDAGMGKHADSIIRRCLTAGIDVGFVPLPPIRRPPVRTTSRALHRNRWKRKGKWKL